MTKKEKHLLLEKAYHAYCHPGFIADDPVSIPHRFSNKEDIEIAAFFAATFAWGKRSVIIQKTNILLEKMNNEPHEFILNFKEKDLKNFKPFVHRTFQFDDLHYFLLRLQFIYREYGSMEKLFVPYNNVKDAIHNFREVFFDDTHFARTEKHLSDPYKNSACKRVNLFLRWMVRTDKEGVDFGIWKNINPSSLMCPLDVHTTKAAHKLGLLNQKVNGWNAVEALTQKLREFDAQDPVKYDFALFGLNIYQSYILPLTDPNRPLT